MSGIPTGVPRALTLRDQLNEWFQRLRVRVEQLEGADADMSQVEFDRWCDELEVWRETRL